MTEIYQPAEDSFLLTEILEKEIPFVYEDKNDFKVIEIGAGSGIHLQTLDKVEVPREHIFAVDLNQNAVEHCKSLGFNCIYSDLFENVEGKYDVIIFNPPYLPEDSREPEDSRLATTGGEKGSELTNEFLEQAENYLETNGKIYLLTSSLTEGIDWRNYHKKLLGSERVFQEELFVWELSL